jgi:hypothetical protein
MDGEVISAIITAIATVFIAWFTGTLWQSNKAQLRHQRQIERPYVSGGGAPASNDRTVFVLTVQNYGRTPGVISHYAVELCLRGNLPPAPDYLNANYTWVSWVATISPGGQTIPLTTRPIPIGPNPVAYGRFRYTTVGRTEEFIFSFILPVGVGDNHSIVANVNPEYTRST